MGRKEGSPSMDHAFTSSPPNEPSQYDAIVVGAGFGGLVSAAILAKEGKRVASAVSEEHTTSTAIGFPGLAIGRRATAMATYSCSWGAPSSSE
jgi:glycine/D-amino acid oxidase-like deaminating enzyme